MKTARSPYFRRALLLLAAVALASLAAFAGLGRSAQPVTLSGPTMGTAWSVKLVPTGVAADASEIRRRIETLLAQINAVMSTYDPQSELSRFNRSRSTQWQPVSEALVEVVAAAQEISADTGGRFDVTVGPLVDLWGFGPEPSPTSVPSTGEIDAARARVGYDKLSWRLEPPALRKAQPDIEVDLSAIAKGYAVDRIAEALDALGIERYLVEIGGELRASGLSPRGDAWRIGVERPDIGSRSLQRVIRLDGLGAATSGDYRNFLDLDGERFAHGIDPMTGYPLRHAAASVTVLAPTTMRADGLATALMMMPPETALDYASKRDIPALFIVHRDGVFTESWTPAMAARLAEEQP